jgi:co-chaperonin GroES (HSP10)
MRTASKTDSDTDRVGYGAVADGAPVRPLLDKVLVLQDDYGDPDELSPGGIHIGGLSVELPEQLTGTVLAVGPGGYNKRGQRVPIALSPGDRVSWSRNFGTLLERTPGDRRQRLIIKHDFLDFVLAESGDASGNIKAAE